MIANFQAGKNSKDLKISKDQILASIERGNITLESLAKDLKVTKHSVGKYAERYNLTSKVTYKTLTQEERDQYLTDQYTDLRKTKQPEEIFYKDFLTATGKPVHTPLLKAWAKRCCSEFANSRKKINSVFYKG